MEDSSQNYFKESPLGCECNEALRTEAQRLTQEVQQNPALPTEGATAEPPISLP